MAEPAAGVRAPGPGPHIRPESFAMVILLTVLVAHGAISNNMVLPSLPALSNEFQVSPGVAMLTISTFFLGFGVGQLFYGSLSDRFGRRPVLMGGLGLYTLASAACIWAPDIETLIVMRLLQGLAAASAQVLARAIVRDHFTPIRAAKMLSLMAAAFTFASAFAPLAGGFAQTRLGWQGVFMTLTLVGALTFLVVWRRFGESLGERDPSAMNPGRMLANYRSLCTSRVFAGYTLTFAAAFAGMFAFHSGSSFVLITLLGFGPETFGLLFAFVLGGYFIGTVFSARTTIKLGVYRLVAIGITSCVISGGVMVALVLASLTGAATILGPQFVFMFGIGIILPNAIAGALGPFSDKAGAASALLGFTQQTVGGAMVALLGGLVDSTALPMAGCIFAGAILALACFVLIVPRPGGSRVNTG